MLDIQSPTSIPPTMPPFYPQTLEHGDDGLKERIVDLIVRLRGMIGELLGEIGKRTLVLWDYAFFTAVGEVARMREEKRER